MVASYYLVCTIWLTTVVVIEWKNISRIWLSIQTNLILPRDQSETSDTPLHVGKIWNTRILQKLNLKIQWSPRLFNLYSNPFSFFSVFWVAGLILQQESSSYHLQMMDVMSCHASCVVWCWTICQELLLKFRCAKHCWTICQSSCRPIVELVPDLLLLQKQSGNSFTSSRKHFLEKHSSSSSSSSKNS